MKFDLIFGLVRISRVFGRAVASRRFDRLGDRGEFECD